MSQGSNALGLDQQLLQDMIADGYDPSEMKAYMGWGKENQLHQIGDSGMKREVGTGEAVQDTDKDKQDKARRPSTLQLAARALHRPTVGQARPRSFTTTY